MVREGCEVTCFLAFSLVLLIRIVQTMHAEGSTHDIHLCSALLPQELFATTQLLMHFTVVSSICSKDPFFFSPP